MLRQFILETLNEIREPDQILKRPHNLLKRSMNAMGGKQRIVIPFGAISFNPFETNKSIEELSKSTDKNDQLLAKSLPFVYALMQENNINFENNTLRSKAGFGDERREYKIVKRLSSCLDMLKKSKSNDGARDILVKVIGAVPLKELLRTLSYPKIIDSITAIVAILNNESEKLSRGMKKVSVDASIIITCAPVDVLRMSDFKGLESCHSPPADKTGNVPGAHAGLFSQAVEEARGGLVAFLVRNDELSRVKLDAPEILSDPDRDLIGVNPLSRVRIRTFIEMKKPNRTFLAAEKKLYGYLLPKFLSVVEDWVKKKNDEFGSSNVDRNDLVGLGGSYYDSGGEELLGAKDARLNHISSVRAKFGAKRLLKKYEPQLRQLQHKLGSDYGATIVTEVMDDYAGGEVAVLQFQFKLPYYIYPFTQLPVGDRAHVWNYPAQVVMNLIQHKFPSVSHEVFSTSKDTFVQLDLSQLLPFIGRESFVDDFKDIIKQIESDYSSRKKELAAFVNRSDVQGAIAEFNASNICVECSLSQHENAAAVVTFEVDDAHTFDRIEGTVKQRMITSAFSNHSYIERAPGKTDNMIKVILYKEFNEFADALANVRALITQAFDVRGFAEMMNKGQNARVLSLPQSEVHFSFLDWNHNDEIHNDKLVQDAIDALKQAITATDISFNIRAPGAVVIIEFDDMLSRNAVLMNDDVVQRCRALVAAINIVRDRLPKPYDESFMLLRSMIIEQIYNA